MAQLVNTILISVVAFFAFLAVFGLLGGAPKGDPPPSGPSVHLAGITARWEDAGAVAARGRGDAAAPEDAEASSPGPSGNAGIILQMTIANGGSASARVTSATYSATSNGVTFDESTEAIEATIAPRRNGTVLVHVRVPTSAVALWWPAYASADELSGLRLQGELRVFDAAGEHQLPFAWSSQWQGALASGLDRAAFACRPGDPVCVPDVAASWSGADLRAELVVVPNEDTLAMVTAGRLDLHLADHLIASSELRPLQSNGALAAALAGDTAALAMWLPDHVERCESSPLEWRLTLDITRSDGTPQTVTWSIRGTFQTHWLCGVSP